jgi:hypothetical protein
MKSSFLLSVAIVVSLRVSAQSLQTTKIQFLHLWKSESLKLEHPYPTPSDTLTIARLKYYVSNIQLRKENTVVWTEPDRYHLIDESNENERQITLTVPENLKYDNVTFLLGIDSLTQSGGVKGGSLDPTNGMYWTWQSGYIHFKLEGSCKTCKSRDKSFHYHIGGYAKPFNTIQSITFEAKPGKNILLQLDLYELLTDSWQQLPENIMSPSAKAIEASQSIRFSSTVK